MTLLDNIKAAVEPAVPLGYGRQPTRVGTKPWVVAWPDSGTVYGATMRWRDGRDVRVIFKGYGLTHESSQFAMARVEAASYAQHMTTVDGRRIWGVEQVDSAVLDREDEQDPPIFVHLATWLFRSTPA